MRHLLRLGVLAYVGMLGLSMWQSTLSPYWAGSDAWSLIGAGVFWFALAAFLAYVWDLVSAGFRARRGRAHGPSAPLK
jgi:hypothetical protein